MGLPYAFTMAAKTAYRFHYTDNGSTDTTPCTFVKWTLNSGDADPDSTAYTARGEINHLKVQTLFIKVVKDLFLFFFHSRLQIQEARMYKRERILPSQLFSNALPRLIVHA
jgi:hypothetical protein